MKTSAARLRSRPSFARLGALGGALAALAACGSSAGVATTGSSGGGGSGAGGGDGGPIATCPAGDDTTIAGACASMACVACQADRTCDPFGFSTRWEGLETCEARTAPLCEKQLAAPSVVAEPASFAACARDTAALTCAAYLAEELPSSCALAPGALADGAPCGFDAQCAAGFCWRELSTSTCGACRVPRAGDDCNEQGTSCGPGLVCSGGVCLSPGKEGASCYSAIECVGTLVCSEGTCAAPRGEGQSCHGYPADDCDHLHGLACDDESRTCMTVPVVDTGGACGQLAGPIGTTIQPVCGPASSCVVHDSPPGSCEARPPDGGDCSQPDPTASARSCQPPALCASGTCEIADPADCH